MEITNIIIPDNKSCAFCDYIKGNRPFTFVYKNSETALMVTREQRGEPHLLVIPIRHAETILEVTDHEAALMGVVVKDAARAIALEYQSEGVAVWQNNGVSASQAIEHVHFHVAGTLLGGGTNWGEVPELEIEETEAIAVRLRPYFNY